MSELDDKAAEETRDETGDALLEVLAWTPKVAPFVGTARYRVRSCLGEGGFGVVYEVEDRELGRRLALKTLKPQRSGFAANVQRLKREFRSVADLVHPNLVGLHELSSDGPRWFFTMDLVRGCDLLTYVRAGASAEARLRACLRQLVAGVTALHEAGIVHRDLKPSNVLVEAGGRVVILDFGLADGEASAGSDLTVAGTPVYMPPEAARGEVSAAADWYAVGVMLYEALTGRRPFDRAERTELVPPSALVPVPADLERLCMALLRADPRARPDAAAVRAMLGEAPAADAGGGEARRSDARSLFVGRAGELAALEAAYAAVQRGDPTLIRLHGQPGVGKSTLLAHFLETLRGEGRAAVLAGRCHERESVPFKAFDGVVDALVRFLDQLPRNQAAGLMPRDIHLVSQLFPVFEQVAALRDVPRRPLVTQDAREVRARAFAALKELVARMADQRPLVIVIDDLQWSDIDSARLLAQLVAPPDRPAVLVVLAYRTDDADNNPTLRETLQTISMAGVPGDEIALAPLPPGEAEALAAALLGAGSTGRSPELARVIAERGEGHPLFIAELARAQLVPDAAEVAPPSLLDILWQRVARLSAGARALLETVAVAGRPLASSLCFEAAGLGDGGIDAARVLRAEQMVRAGDRGEINVFHDRVRDAVLLRSDAAVRRRRHLALARALERRSELDLEALARHFDAADEHVQAARYALRAADAAMEGFAFERAAALYRMAIDRGGASSAELEQKLGFALRDAGRNVAAGEAFLAAAGHIEGDSAQKTELLRSAAENMLMVGDSVAGFDVVRQALAAVGERLPTQRQAMLMFAGLMVRVRVRRARFRRRDEAAIDRDELLRLDVLDSASKGLEPHDGLVAMALRGRHYQLAMKAGEPRRVAQALVGAMPALLGFKRSMPPLAYRLMEAAIAIGDELDDPEIRSRILMTRGMGHFIFGEWAAGAELSEQASSLIAERCRGMATQQHDALLIAADCHMRAGRFAQARRLAEALRLWAIERADSVYEKQVSAGVLAPLRLAADDPDGAMRLLEQIGSEPRCPSIVMRGEAFGAIALYCGRPRDAIQAWRSRWSQLREVGAMVVMGIRLHVVRGMAIALLAGAEDRREIREAAGLVRSIRRLTFPYARGTYRLLRSLLAVHQGRPDQAPSHLADAARSFDEAGAPHDAAACRLRRGQLIGGADGAREIADADQTLRAIGIASPERWSAMLIPAVAPLPGRRLLVE